MYISRLRPHDADKKRREFARQRALYLDSQRSHFIEHCLKTGVPEHEMNLNLQYLDDIIQVWLDVADQGKVD